MLVAPSMSDSNVGMVTEVLDFVEMINSFNYCTNKAGNGALFLRFENETRGQLYH